MTTKTETAILEAVTEQQKVLKILLDRMDALEEKPEVVEVTSHDAAIAAPKKVTTLKTDDPELVALRGAITRPAKADLIDKCAQHSHDALQTMILAGSKAAREFMRGDIQLPKSEGEFHLRLESSNGKYAHALLGRLEKGKSPTVVTSHTRSRMSAGQEDKLKGLLGRADMSDKELLKFRPKGASEKYAAKHAWLKRTRANLS